MFGNRGPGGLSINTNAANSTPTAQPPKSGGLFGSVQQSKPAGSLFGATATSSHPQNSLFGTSNQGGGLFGSTTNTSQPQGNSLFGAAGTAQGGGLFGPSTTTLQPQQSNNVFGGSLLGGQGSNNQQTQTGGLFGSSTAQFSQPQSTNLFGTTNAQQSQPQQQGGGMFASLGQTQTQTQNNGLFGNSNGQNKTNTCFGSSSVQNQSQPHQHQQLPQQQQAPSIFTNSIGQLSHQQQTVPGVRISVNELRPTTRFNDLHEELQRVIENIDNFILEQMKFQGECERAINGDESIENPGVKGTYLPLPGELKHAETTLDTLQEALENDAQAIANVKIINAADQHDAKLGFQAISALRMPQQYQHPGLRHNGSTTHIAAPSLIGEFEDGAATNLVSYFSKQTDGMSSTLNVYKYRLGEVEAYLNGMEVSMMDQMQQLMFLRGQDGEQKSVEDQVKELAAVLKEMQSGIGGVAGKLSGTRERVQEVVLGGGG